MKFSSCQATTTRDFFENYGGRNHCYKECFHGIGIGTKSRECPERKVSGQLAMEQLHRAAKFCSAFELDRKFEEMTTTASQSLKATSDYILITTSSSRRIIWEIIGFNIEY